MSKPDLSVAIIFKNEIRCLARCLESVQPLREQISVQIVMADTGSTDGSRAVAEQYADVLFDFPWINDFAAARNAVLDRCTGGWALVMDCDEWLDPDMGELVRFLRDPRAKKARSADVVVRNYYDAAFETYGEFIASRLLRLSAAPRYVGAIHEFPLFNGQIDQCEALNRVVLHHDGYVMLNDGSEAGKEKRARNAELLYAELERKPNDLRLIVHLLECESNAVAQYALMRRAVPLACANPERAYARFLLRDAIYHAYLDHLPEFEEWVKKAEEIFPKSYIVRIDVNYLCTKKACDQGDYAEATRRGEAYLRAFGEFKSEKSTPQELAYGMLNYCNASVCIDMRLVIAKAYQKLDQYDLAHDTLGGIAWEEVSAEQTARLIAFFGELYLNSGTMPEKLVSSLWNSIQKKRTSGGHADKRREYFLKSGLALFDYTDAGESPWQIFLPLQNSCVLGDYAALWEAQTAEQADDALQNIDSLAEIPNAAFIHALKIGAEFPLPDRPPVMELADVMANKLSSDAGFLREAAIYTAEAFECDADLNWARALALAALQNNDWKADTDPQLLLRAFVRIESAFLARCYSAHALQTPDFLPPMHRFALHLANAFAVLVPAAVSPEFTPSATGNVSAALAELKKAAVAAPEQKAVIGAALDNVLGGTL